MSRVLVLLLLASACVGEASVSYQGAVIEGATSSYAFEPSPAAGTPVAGATVALCFDSKCSDPARTATTDSDGRYAEIESVFGGFVGSDTHIEVRATALDGRTASYSTTYEDTKDPTVANPDGTSAVYLNFTLAPP